MSSDLNCCEACSSTNVTEIHTAEKKSINFFEKKSPRLHFDGTGTLKVTQ
jgi:hypothetical protein